MYGNHWFAGGTCLLGAGGYFSMWALLILLGFAVLITGVLLLVRDKHASHDQAIEMLNMMYVNNELTEEEYLKRKKAIERK